MPLQGRVWHSTCALSTNLAEASNFYTDGDGTQETWLRLQARHKALQRKAIASAGELDIATQVPKGSYLQKVEAAIEEEMNIMPVSA